MELLRSPTRRLRLAVLAALAVTGLLILLAAVQALAPGAAPSAVAFGGTVDPPLPPWAQLAVILLAGVPFMLGLWRLSRMLRVIEQGAPFASATVAHLRAFAALVLVSALASILLPPILAAIAAQPGTRLTLTFDGSDFFVLLVSGLMFLLARLLGEAQRIADENSQIV